MTASDKMTLAGVFAIVSCTSSGCALLFVTGDLMCGDDIPAHAEAARTTAGILSTLARVHREQTGFLPDSVEDLGELGRFDETPLDPWGHPFLYWVVDNEPVFVSLGSDGECGDDIASDGYQSNEHECRARTTACFAPKTDPSNGAKSRSSRPFGTAHAH